jgi:energy-coupling factor transporter ATP-binding protein EcfA2
MKLNIDLKNCYGISELNHCFDFTNSRGYAIYAPNGFMKTSLSKTFDDHANGRDSVDLIFPDRVSSRAILDAAGATVDPGSIFVIEPYNQEFASEKTSLLLVNSAIKQQYDDALKQISEKQTALFSKLKQLSGLTGRTLTPETEFTKVFGSNSVTTLLDSLEQAVSETAPSKLADLVYCEIFNDKTIALLESGTIKDQLEEYIGKYNDLVSKSDVLSKQFNHYSAGTVNKQLTDNGFFAAKHTINLNTKNGKQEVSSAQELTKRIEDERGKIFSDKELAGKFDAIDKKIQNAELRKFRDYLFENQEILPELKNFKRLQKDVWIAYLANQKELYDQFLTQFRVGKVTIEEAVKQAKEERTDWEKVVVTFNKRFFVPFKMSVSNQEDVILKGTKPSIAFMFSDGEREGDVARDSLLKVLSQGEKRALYILNILFEIQSRQKQGGITILLVDDIADSFDYKNKYAIIEYLKDIVNSGNFHCIFLSHNFDFYRSISGRLNLGRQYKLMASKIGRRLTLTQEKYQNNPFMFWKGRLHEPPYCISAIPFVRNLAEYCGHDADYLTLTSLLHMKADTETITLDDLCVIYKKILSDKQNLVLPPAGKTVMNVLLEEADLISAGVQDHIELESKIVMSIAIRLLAEKHMIRRINDQAFVNGITQNQTIELLKEYKRKNLGSLDETQKLEQVNLMTPENIHLNSFMYEPILDMGSAHLRSLYADVKLLA